MSKFICVGAQDSVVELLRCELSDHEFSVVEHELRKGELGRVQVIEIIRSVPLMAPPEPHHMERRVAEYQAPGRARHKKGKR